MRRIRSPHAGCTRRRSGRCGTRPIWPVLSWTARCPSRSSRRRPVGGESGGLIYLLAHLNRIAAGELLGNLSIAATGRLGDDGYVGTVMGIDDKAVAAELAHADVVFLPALTPTVRERRDEIRLVGEMHRARGTGAPLAEERRWARYGSGEPPDPSPTSTSWAFGTSATLWPTSAARARGRPAIC